VFNLKSLLYDFRITAGWFFWVPLLMIPLLALVGYLVWRDVEVTMRTLLGVFELWLPILFGVMVSPLMSAEHDARFYELRQSYPESALRVPLQRTLLSLLYFVLLWLLALVAFRISYGAFDLGVLLLPIAPALFTASLSLLIGTLSRNSFIPAVAIFAYVLFDYQSAGAFTGPLYLMNGFLSNGTDLLLNRTLLVVASVVLVLINCAVHVYRKNSVRRSPVSAH